MENPGAEQVLVNWISKKVELANVSGGQFKCYTAGFLNDHWFPFVLSIEDENIVINTTPDGRITLEHLIQEAFQNTKSPMHLSQHGHRQFIPSRLRFPNNRMVDRMCRKPDNLFANDS